MRFMHLAAAVAAATMFGSPAGAADAPTTMASAQPVNPAAQVQLVAMPRDNVIRAGTEIALVTHEELTIKKKLLRIGQRVQLEVGSNVMLNSLVVVPVGTPAVGEITEVRNKGMWGKSGYIAVRLISMRLGNRTVRLSELLMTRA